MESKMASDTVPAKQTKVTLTNWERLTNAPLPLTGASAVQWNDYLFVLPRDGMTLLYHTKTKIWSLLPQSPYTNSNTTPPALTVHNGHIFTMSMKGEVASYDFYASKWTKLQKMSMNLRNQYNFVLISYQNNIYAIAASDKHSNCLIYSNNPNKFGTWTKISEFGHGSLTFATVISGTMFIHTGGEIYKVLLEKKEEMKTPLKIARPPYEGFTFYAVKDTLFSFGGRDRDHQPTSDVLRYNPDTDTWESAGYMRSARYNVAVTTIQDTTLDVFVLGGSFGSSQYTVQQQQSTKGLGFSLTPAIQSSAQSNWDDTTSIFEKCTVD